MEGDVQMCKHCRREVASAHFILHEAHCVRFLVVCPECEEPIPKKEIEEHFENWHKEVECTLCQQHIQKYLLEVHETQECPKRQVPCKFCELALGLNKLEIHERQCGSRTERCPDCNQFILLRELVHHKDTCAGGQAWSQREKRLSGAMRKINCNFCNKVIPLNKYASHTDKCGPFSGSTKLSPFEKQKKAPPSHPNQSFEDGTSMVKKDVYPKMKNGFTFLSQNSTKQESRGKPRPLDRPLKPVPKARPSSPTGDDEDAYNILRKCSQCDILLPLPTLNRHQEKCLRLAPWKEKHPRNFS